MKFDSFSSSSSTELNQKIKQLLLKVFFRFEAAASFNFQIPILTIDVIHFYQINSTQIYPSLKKELTCNSSELLHITCSFEHMKFYWLFYSLKKYSYIKKICLNSVFIYKHYCWIFLSICSIFYLHVDHLNLLAYLSLSMSSRTSPTLTGPLTFLIRCLLSAYLPEMRVTLTWVIPPLEPVLPSNWVTLAFTG